MPLVSSYLTYPPIPFQNQRLGAKDFINLQHKTSNSKRRYISVALSLKSPSPGVTRHHCPLEPGLSSYMPFQAISAIIWLTHYIKLLKYVYTQIYSYTIKLNGYHQTFNDYTIKLLTTTPSNFNDYTNK